LSAPGIKITSLHDNHALSCHLLTHTDERHFYDMKHEVHKIICWLLFPRKRQYRNAETKLYAYHRHLHARCSKNKAL